MHKTKTIFVTLILLFILWAVLPANAQEPYNRFNIKNYSAKLLSELLLKKVNRYRTSKDLSPLTEHDILMAAAKDQAAYIGSSGRATTEQDNRKKATTGKRVEYYGGTENAGELVQSTKYRRRGRVLTYEQIADEILRKWKKSKRKRKVLLRPEYLYTGIGITTSSYRKRIYISQVFGGIKVMNKGAAKRKELPVPYSKKNFVWRIFQPRFWIKPYDSRKCRKCNRYKNLNQLQDGLFVKDGNVYFRHDNIRKLRRLITRKKDGLAVDIIQKEQYPCSTDYNIYDNTNNLSKGVLLKRMYRNKLLRKNIYKNDPEHRNQLLVKMGKLPNGIKDGYELNLIVIQQKSICASLQSRYLPNEANLEARTNLNMVPDINYSFEHEPYNPVDDKTTLTYKVPFEKNEYKFKTKDVKPLHKALKSPDYIVDSVGIVAHTSLEGKEAYNFKLQRRRARSIKRTIKRFREKRFKITIETDDSYKLFREQVQGTRFEALADKAKSEVLKVLNEELWEDAEMEAILANERFTEIHLKVTYDHTGKKEEEYVVALLNKAIEDEDLKLALRIQKYMIDRILDRKYSIKMLDQVNIPNNPKFIALEMNNLWAGKEFHNDLLDSTYLPKLEKLSKKNPDNPVVLFNYLLAKLETDSIEELRTTDSLQVLVNRLYESPIEKDYVDAINLKLQFSKFDMTGTDPQDRKAKKVARKTMKRIRKIYNAEATTWQNALKLSNIFMGMDEYLYALELIEPFALEEKPAEEVLFTYIALTGQFDDKIYTQNFRAAMQKAGKVNKNRFCALFGEPYMSFQLMDDPIIKKQYCDNCYDAEEYNPESETTSMK